MSYFGHKNAWLAQTAEFHQQMALSMDFTRVFEVRTMFRAENDQNSKRRLAEVCRDYLIERALTSMQTVG